MSLPLLWLTSCGWWSTPTTDAPPIERQCVTNPSTGCFAPVPTTTARLGEGAGREVTLPGFWMQREELGVSAWKACVSQGACDPAQVDGDNALSTLRDGKGSGRPLNLVTFEGARQVCAWHGGRLPDETAWEAAARGTDGRRWPWGDTPGCGLGTLGFRGAPSIEGAEAAVLDEMVRDACALHDVPSANRFVGESPFGMVGMAGGVWEWVTGETARAGMAPVRGGSWLEDDPQMLQVTSRLELPVDSRLPDVGVRCVWGTR